MNKQRFTAALRQFAPGVLIALSLSMPSRVIAQHDGAAGAPPPPGTLVDIGGYRLHIYCQGTGDPAVVMLAGGGDFSFDWSLVQPGVARFARACAYDRAGLAWSDLGPTPRTMRQDAHELHLLLERSGVKGPVVLVGHSVGGLIARVYVDRYPGSVAGLVLVDSTHEDTTLMFNGKVVRVREGARGASIPPVQTMKTSPPAPPSAADKEQFEMNRKMFGPPKIEPPFDRLPPRIQQLRLWALSHPKLAARGEDFWADELQAMYTARKTRPQPLGDTPLTVLIGGKESDAPPGVAADDWKRLAAEKREQKLGFADLSRNSKVVIDPKSGHHVALENPELVVDTIRQVVEAARHGGKLESIAAAQVGSGVAAFVTSVGATGGFTDPNSDNQETVKDLRNALKKYKEVALVEKQEQAAIVLVVQSREKGRQVVRLGALRPVREYTVKTKFQFKTIETEMSGVENGGDKAAGKVAEQVRDWIRANRDKIGGN